MSPREKLQMAYELAFHPPRLNATWNEWDRGRISDIDTLREAVDWALALHQRLPEAPAVSLRALGRLSRYQARARAYRMPSTLRRFRLQLGDPSAIPDETPPWMVRDFGIPVFQRSRNQGSRQLQGVRARFDDRNPEPLQNKGPQGPNA